MGGGAQVNGAQDRGSPAVSPAARGAATEGLNTWCAISVGALEHNVAQLRGRLPGGCRLAAVVKSNAYGHGMVDCARHFLRAGADWLVVNGLYEAQRLRRHGIEAPVYVCGPVAPGQAGLAASTGARVALYDADTARALDRAARQTGTTIRVHVKLETGMHRQGLELRPALDLARLVEALPGLRLEGLTSHMADMDEIGPGSAAQAQTERFAAGLSAFRQAGHVVEVAHLASSGGALRLAGIPGTLVRTGIAAYGLWPSAAVARGVGGAAKLRPALSWHCRVAQVKEVPAGAAVGYGGTYVAPAATRLAILPVGYGEGYPRSLSGCGEVVIEGRRWPVRGRVCMNMTIVEVAGDHAPAAGAVATLIGGPPGGERVGADEVAQRAGTINYEVTTRIHPDVPRLMAWPDGRLTWAEANSPDHAAGAPPPLELGDSAT